MQTGYEKYMAKREMLYDRLKPVGKTCDKCQHYTSNSEDCRLFGGGILDCEPCDECKYIFGEV